MEWLSEWMYELNEWMSAMNERKKMNVRMSIRWVCEMWIWNVKCDIEWNEWNEVKWNEMKWNEMKWQMLTSPIEFIR